MSEQIIRFSKRIYCKESLLQAKNDCADSFNSDIREDSDSFQFAISPSMDNGEILEELKNKILLNTILISDNE